MGGASIPRSPVHLITLVQVVSLGVVWGVLHFAADPLVAESLVLGGLIAVLPQAYFAWRVFRYRGAQAASHIARASYAGETGKILLAATGFALVFAFVRPLQAWVVFAGYGGMVIIQVTGSWLLLRQAAPVNRT